MKPTLYFFSILCLAAALIVLGGNQPPSRNQTFTSKAIALNAPASELLEEDFVVAPGADPRAITMEIARHDVGGKQRGKTGHPLEEQLVRHHPSRNTYRHKRIE